MNSHFDPAQAARDSVYVVGPHTYTLANAADCDETNFLVLGCHGSGNDHQKRVASMMDEKIRKLKADGKPLPKFILFLGDNIYEHGVNSPAPSSETKGFTECFVDVYKTEKRGELKEIPCFLVLGNHDYDFDVANASNPMHSTEIATKLASNQVARTYFSSMAKTITEKIKRFMGDELRPEELQTGWNMPYFFYSLIAGDTQVFCLDSNTFLHDYLTYKDGKVNADGLKLDAEGKPIEPHQINQAHWLKKEYALAQKSGRQIIFAQHHPLRVAAKRAFPKKFDSLHYLTSTEINALSKHLYGNDCPDIGLSYNQMLNDAFKQMGCYPDLLYAAHEHAISYTNTKTRDEKKPLVQFISGGGGGDKLDARHSYRDHPYLGMYQQHYGYSHITCNGKKKTFEIATHIDGLESPIKFIQDHHRPFIAMSENALLNELRYGVLAACKQYFNSLRDAEDKLIHEDPATAETTGYTIPGAKFVSAWSSFFVTQGQMFLSNVRDILFKDAGRKENNHIEDIHAYFIQHQLGSFKDAVTKLFEMTRTDCLPSRNLKGDTFYAILEGQIKASTKFTLDEIFAQVGLQGETKPELTQEKAEFSL